MSRFETDQFINDRYAKMEERLAVSCFGVSAYYRMIRKHTVGGSECFCCHCRLLVVDVDHPQAPEPASDAGGKGGINSGDQ
jgi:hypothetical protein